VICPLGSERCATCQTIFVGWLRREPLWMTGSAKPRAATAIRTRGVIDLIETATSRVGSGEMWSVQATCRRDSCGLCPDMSERCIARARSSRAGRGEGHEAAGTWRACWTCVIPQSTYSCVRSASAVWVTDRGRHNPVRRPLRRRRGTLEGAAALDQDGRPTVRGCAHRAGVTGLGGVRIQTVPTPATQRRLLSRHVARGRERRSRSGTRCATRSLQEARRT
jgi:hypothetical protein